MSDDASSREQEIRNATNQAGIDADTCAIPNLSDYLAAVEDGTWQELFCDGSGVLPARAKKVMR